MNRDEEINLYCKDCWNHYKLKTSIPENYRYLNGNQVKVHVPVDTAEGGLMIIGAYPTAYFNAIGNERDVPVADHLYPFSNEKYFDGSRIREVESGRELEQLFLKPLEIVREKCWITDLVKVFLFKEGHVKKYERLGYKDWPVTRDRFTEFAKNSIPHINEEIELCQPKVILGLGAEVNAIMLNKSIREMTKEMKESKEHSYILNGKNYPYFSCPHPGILMRGGTAAEKWKQILGKILVQAKKKL